MHFTSRKDNAMNGQADNIRNSRNQSQSIYYNKWIGARNSTMLVIAVAVIGLLLSGCRNVPNDGAALRAAFPKMSRAERGRILEDAAMRKILAEGTPYEIDGVFNFRDLGGKTGLDGRRVRTGVLYRSARFDQVTDAGRRRIVGELGVRTDLDLRRKSELVVKDASPLGDGVRFELTPIPLYDGIFTKDGRAAFARALKVAMDERNWPLAFHCKTGKDRTGTLAFVLLTLLGVDEETICLDWELTAFHVPELSRLSHAPRYDRLLAGFMELSGATLREKVEGYVHSLGISEKEISEFRERMLERKKQEDK